MALVFVHFNFIYKNSVLFVLHVFVFCFATEIGTEEDRSPALQFFLSEKLFHFNIHHTREEKTIITIVSSPLGCETELLPFFTFKALDLKLCYSSFVSAFLISPASLPFPSL